MKISSQAVINKESIFVLASKGVDMVGAICFLKLVSTRLGQGDMGVYLLITSLVALMLTFTFSPLSQGVLRNVSVYVASSELVQRYSSAMIFYIIFCPIIFGGLLALGFLVGFLHELKHYVFLIILWASLDAVKTLNTTIAAALRQRDLIFFSGLVDCCVKISLILFFCFFDDLRVEYVLMALVGSCFSVISFISFKQRDRIGRPTANLAVNTLRAAFVFSWPMMIWGVFAWLQNMSGRWVLDYFYNSNAVADFGVLVSIGTMPVAAIFGVVSAYIQPIVYEAESSQAGSSRGIVLRAFYILLPVTFFVILFSFVFSSEIVSLLAHSSYANNSFYLPLIVLSISLSSLGGVLSYFVLAARKTFMLLVPNVFPGLFGLIVSVLLVPSYGLQGAILGIVLSHFTSFLMLIFVFCLLSRSAVFSDKSIVI